MVMSVKQNTRWTLGILYGPYSVPSCSLSRALVRFWDWDYETNLTRISQDHYVLSPCNPMKTYPIAITSLTLKRMKVFLSHSMISAFFVSPSPHTQLFPSLFFLCVLTVPQPQPILVLISLPWIKCYNGMFAYGLFHSFSTFLLSIYYSLSIVLSAGNATVYRTCKKSLHFWL